MCQYSCLTGFLDCNGGTDGCEVDTRSDTNNCGTCGHVCPVATPFCSAGTCVATGAYPIPFAPEPISGTSIGLGDDQYSGDIPIGFNFVFFGITYTTVDICSNGFLTFNSAGNGFCTYVAQSIPTADGYDNMIAYNWHDIYMPSGGSLQYETRGSAPNRRFVISLTNAPFYADAAQTVTSQTILYEGSNRIEVYTTSQPVDSFGRTYTQGVENASGTTAFFLPGRVTVNYSVAGDGVLFLTN